MDALFMDFITVPWVRHLLVGAYALTLAAVVLVVISENRNPVKSLAWLLVLLFVPGGIIIYFIFGRDFKNTRMISRHNRRRLRRKESGRKVKIDKFGFSKESEQQIDLGRRLGGAMLYPNNSAQIFTSGQKKFDSLLRDIAAAEKYINIQYYIFADDNIGRRVRQALMDKARQGVAVRVMYDSVGSTWTSRRFFRKLRQAGAQVHPFQRVILPLIATRINWRNHRKLCIIDGKIGYIGGMNVADRYIDPGKGRLWRDTHLRIEGPAVRSLQYSFAVDWTFNGQPLIEDDFPDEQFDNRNPQGLGMQLLTSGPTLQWANLAMLFIKAIGNAKRRVFLQTPYFLPTDALLKTLQTAALSGVDVRVMVPKSSDSRMLDFASASYFAECMQSGVKFYLYTPGMMHSKTLLVDDEFVSIGSTNFDFRSFECNYESNLQIYSKEFNAQMADIFLTDLKECERLDHDKWRRRPRSRRAVESVVRLLSPIL